jgi:hypothetical protein
MGPRLMGKREHHVPELSADRLLDEALPREHKGGARQRAELPPPEDPLIMAAIARPVAAAAAPTPKRPRIGGPLDDPPPERERPEPPAVRRAPDPRGLLGGPSGSSRRGTVYRRRPGNAGAGAHRRARLMSRGLVTREDTGDRTNAGHPIYLWRSSDNGSAASEESG